MPNLRSLSLFALLVIAFIFLGCGKRETHVESGIRDGILHVGNGTEPQDIDPQTVTGVPEHNIITAVLEGLVREDPVDLHPVPGVAESWEISEDGRVYTFHLREDAKWSNGDPVTATDFVLSYRRMLTPTLGAEYSSMLHYVVNAREFNAGELTDFSRVGFKAPDDRTLEITLKNPTPFFLNLLNHYSWFPIHIPTVEKFGGLDRKGTKWTLPGNFVGNGPFNLKDWRMSQMITVEKSDTYWDRDNVSLNEIRFYPIESQDTEERMFRTGQLHYTNSIPLSKIDVYKAENPDLLHIDPYLGTYFLRANVTEPPFDDVRIRRALALAIDRESLVTNVTKGGQIPAYHFTPPGTAGFTARARLEGDLETARQLLTDAGFPNGEGLPRLELLYNTSESHRVLAEALQQMWRKRLNIDVSLVNEEWKVYLDSQDTLSYQICRGGWIGDFVDPHTFLEMFVTDGGNNDTGWSNDRYDELTQLALKAPDDVARFEIYQEMEAILMEELPIIPIYFYTKVNLRQPSVKGFHPTILDHHPYQHIYLEEDGTDAPE
ncbi:MAG: peptide ABC transporter substrate-binding protein [Verrucomicrobia bacterium]|nr:MAG: peptide ABC transporter substrate-binding protein [Verrucomicrobiota bacterium]